MSALYNKASPYFFFSIKNGVNVTAPVFMFGETPATLGASLMSSSGARIAGTLAMGMTISHPPSDSSTSWVLPKNEGNCFLMDMLGDSSPYIAKINHRTVDWSSRGYVAILMFEYTNCTVSNGRYINLNNGANFIRPLME